MTTRRRTVGELHEHRVRASRAPRHVPVERGGVYALHQPAAEQTDDIELVRALAERHAAAE